MKTVSADYAKTNYTVPVDVHTMHRHYIHLPSVSIRKVIAKPGNRFLWMGVVMLAQSILITPFVSVIILYTGNWIPLWFAAAASTYATFIPCLSGQNLNWIKTIFFINCLVNVFIIVGAVLHLFII